MFKAFLILLIVSTPAFAEVYRVVEDGVVQEYNVMQTEKSREQIVAEIESLNGEIQASDEKVTYILAAKDAFVAEKVKLEALLLELPEAEVIVTPPTE